MPVGIRASPLATRPLLNRNHYEIFLPTDGDGDRITPPASPAIASM